MSSAGETDLESCASEPIHIPGSIQPHGALLVLHPEALTIVQATGNVPEVIGVPVEIGAPLPEPLAVIVPELREWLRSDERSFQQIVALGNRTLHAVAHQSQGALILEFEAVPSGELAAAERLFPKLRSFAEKLPAAADTKNLAALAASYVRNLTGFDRVLVYQFDSEWNGRVIGEDGNGVLPSYLDLRFPAGDIPPQARELYKLNRLRIIPSVDYRPVPIEPAENPLTGEPLDLSFALLRSVSPIHLEYMRNMGTSASMSVSVIVNGELWGLISCHSREPHHVTISIRDLCDFAAQSFAAEIASRHRALDAASRLQLGGVLTRLLGRMTGAMQWWRGLAEDHCDLISQVNASGAAIVFDDECNLLGETPPEEQVRLIVDWLEKRGETDIFSSDRLGEQLPALAPFAGVASGVLAVRLSELHPCWLLWFRPEVIRTVTWGGDPHKVVREEGRIHPRRSFEAWSEQVRGQATQWSEPELSVALDLRTAIIGIVLRRAEELAQLSTELQRSNKELEAFSYSISHDLRAPFRHVVGYSELLKERARNLDEKSSHYLDSIIDSARAAGRLVDDLLHFSHIGRTAIAARDVDMDKLVAEVRQSLALNVEGREIDWRVERLPAAWGDPALLRQVWFNMIENAVKYTRNRASALISVSSRTQEGETCYLVEDNGVGFDMAYVSKLFGVFQRLQRSEDFEGTGIGLALARRIIERHNGRVWAEGELDKGARFYFSLPLKGGSPIHA